MAVARSLVVPLAAGDDLTLVGGKAANLARLIRAGFAVPDGFVLTTSAYDAFVHTNDLEPVIRDATDRLKPDDPDRLAAASAAIRGEFALGELSDRIASAVDSACATLGVPAVAVRSSATAEDLPEMSFAGQQDTYLNVVGGEALLEAIVNCWGSLWTARAIGYRARHKIPGAAVSMAVLVQSMVRAEASGVVFTANPLNGKRTEMAIDAGLGLGEALVSGRIEADHYVVSPDGRILDTASGSACWATASSSSVSVPPPARDRIEIALRPRIVITELARLATRVAKLQGAPQDIEWSWDGRQLSLLQTRAITSLFPLPDGLPVQPLRVLFSFGAVQGMLDPMTPLGRHSRTGRRRLEAARLRLHT